MLFREKINDWANFTDEKNSGVYPYKYSDSFMSGWLDITSIETIDLYGFSKYIMIDRNCEINQ